MARATATAGGAVAFAGTTVVIALCSLVAAGIPLVSTMGYTAAVAVAVAVVAAVTLLPAMLGALGPRIDSLRVHFGKTHPDDHEPHGWRRWAGGVARRPWASMIAGGRGARGARRAGAQPPPRAERRRRDVQGHHRAPGLRPDLRGLRPGPERAAAGGGPARAARRRTTRRSSTTSTSRRRSSRTSSSNRSSRTPSRESLRVFARRGAGPGRAEGPAQQGRPAEAGRPEEAARVAGQRSAAADAAERHRQDHRASSPSRSPCSTRRAARRSSPPIATTAPSSTQDRGPRERPARQRDPQGGQGHRPRP